MIIYWDSLEKNAIDPILIPAYLATDYFSGGQRVRSLADYPPNPAYGAFFHHSGYKRLFGFLEDVGWRPVPGAGHLTLRPEINLDEIKKQTVPVQVQAGIFFGYSMPVYDADHEELYFRQEVPGRWDGISDIVAHLTVALAGAEDVGDNFKFELSWDHAKVGEPIPAATHDVEIQQAVLTDRNAEHDIYDLEFTLDYDVDGEGSEVKALELLACRLRRIDAADPDVSNAIIVISLDVHYKVNKVFKS